MTCIDIFYYYLFYLYMKQISICFIYKFTEHIVSYNGFVTNVANTYRLNYLYRLDYLSQIIIYKYAGDKIPTQYIDTVLDHPLSLQI